MRTPTVLPPLAILAVFLPACAALGERPSAPYQRYRSVGYAEPGDMRVALELGARTYRGQGWDRLDEQPAIGFTATHEPPHWLMGLEGGLIWAGGDDDLLGVADVEVDTWESFAGVMKSFPLIQDQLVLELGAGYSLSYVFVDHDDTLLEGDDAWWSSGYGRAALLLRLGDDAWIGLSGRSARGGSGNLMGAPLDGDYDQLAFVLTARW